MSLNDGTTDYTFEQDPYYMTEIRENKDDAVVDTYEGAEYFEWDETIVGKSLTLKWHACPATQFDQFKAFRIGGKALVFDPDIGTGKTYNVRMINPFDGDYLIGEISSWRENVVITLFILSEVT